MVKNKYLFLFLILVSCFLLFAFYFNSKYYLSPSSSGVSHGSANPPEDSCIDPTSLVTQCVGEEYCKCGIANVLPDDSGACPSFLNNCIKLTVRDMDEACRIAKNNAEGFPLSCSYPDCDRVGLKEEGPFKSKRCCTYTRENECSLVEIFID